MSDTAGTDFKKEQTANRTFHAVGGDASVAMMPEILCPVLPESATAGSSAGSSCWDLRAPTATSRAHAHVNVGWHFLSSGQPGKNLGRAVPGPNMTNQTNRIIWAQIAEAPALATFPLHPIVRAFLRGSGVEVETRDISLAGRILAAFPELLAPEQRVEDHLAWLGDLTLRPDQHHQAA